MGQSLSNPTIFRLVSFGFMLLILCVIIMLTTRISFRFGKLDAPKLKVLFAIAFLQVFLSATILSVIEKIQEEDLLPL